MIDIYARHFKLNGSIVETKTLLQTIPAKNEGELYFINPKVSVKAGSAESMDFSIQPRTKYYDAFFQMKTFISVEFDGDLIFYGRVLTIENSFFGEQRIKCEGAMAFFNDSYYPGSSEDDRDEISLGTYINRILTNHNEQLLDSYRYIYPGEVPGNYTSATAEEQRIETVTRKFGETGWRQTKAVLDDLTSHYGGMFRVRLASNGKLYLDWYKHYYKSSVNNQKIKLGENLINANSITEVNNIFTVVIPIGKGESSEKKLYITGMYFPVSRVFDYYTADQLRSGYHVPEDYLEAESKYGKIIKPQEFNEAETEEDLLKECAKWVKENYQGGVEEFSVTAIDLHQIGNKNINKILVGDRVPINYPNGNGAVIDRTLTCTAITYELYNPENNSYTFGIPASSLKGYSVNDSKSKKDSQAAETADPGTGNTYHDNRTDYERWYDKVVDFLTQHRVWKRHSWIPGQEGGPNRLADIDKFVYLSGSASSSAYIWVPTAHKIPYHSPNRPDYEFELDSEGHPKGHWEIQHVKYFYRKRKDYKRDYDLTKNHLIEYIMWEHNVNFGSSMPETIVGGLESVLTNAGFSEWVDDDGNIQLDKFLNLDFKDVLEQGKEFITTKIGSTFSGIFSGDGFNVKSLVSGLIELKDSGITTIWEGIKSKATAKFGELAEQHDGSLLGSIFQLAADVGSGEVELADVNPQGLLHTLGGLDTDGDSTFTDEEGNKVSSRAAHTVLLDTVNETNKIGFVAKKYFGDDLTNPDATHELTLSIEKVEGGQIVVARVSGDEVLIGGNGTSQVVTGALNNISHVCGEFTWKRLKTGERKVTLKNGSGLFLDKEGTEYGVYHEGNLSGGIMVQKINDDEVNTHIIGDRIIVGDKSGTYYAGYISDDHLHFYSDEEKQHEIEDHSSSKFYGDIPSDKVYVWTGSIFQETSKTLDLQTSNMKGMIGTKATVTELNAVKARVNTLEVDFADIEVLNSKIGRIDNILVKSLNFADGSSPTGGSRITNLRQLIHGVRIVAEGTAGTYKLQYQTGNSGWDENDWQDAGTFNSAASVTLSGSWSGGVLTVTPSPAGSKWIRTLHQTTASWSGYDVTIPVNVYRVSGATEYDEGTIVNTFVSVPSSKRYSTGVSDERALVRTRFNANNGMYYIESYENTSSVPAISGTSITYKLAIDSPSSRGAYVKIYDSNNNVISNSAQVGLSSYWDTAYGSGVSHEKGLVKARFGSASTGYYIEGYENTTGYPSISGSNFIYKLAIDSPTSRTANVKIYDSSNNVVANTASLSLSDYWDTAAASATVEPEWIGQGYVDNTDHLPTGTQHRLSNLPTVIKQYLNYRTGYIYFRIKIGGTYHVYYFTPITTS